MKILDVVVGVIINRRLEKYMGFRPSLWTGSPSQIPSKLLDRLINLIVACRSRYYVKMQREMLEGGTVDIPSNIFDWKALERTSGYLRLYMEEFHGKFVEIYDGNFPVEDFKDWFHEVHSKAAQGESAEKSVSEALLADDLPRV